MIGNLSYKIKAGVLLAAGFSQFAATATLSNKPLHATGFIENIGQLKNTNGAPASEVLFYGKLPGVNVFLTLNAIIYDFIHADNDFLTSSDIPLNRTDYSMKPVHHYRLDMRFNTEGVMPHGFGINNHTSNFYIGNNENLWYSGVRNFNGVRYPDIYPGIDLLVYFKDDGSGIKYDFELKSGADPGLINYQYQGATSVLIDAYGQLQIETPAGKLTEENPFSFQYINGKKKKLESSFVKRGENLGFSVSGFDRNETLIIDPSILVWSTYYGGGGSNDQSRHLADDSNGNLIMCGLSNSTNFPVSIGASQSTLAGGGQDGFLAKFSPDGNRIWSTYYGGSGVDDMRSCETDASGNVFMIGTTQSLNLPLKNPGGGAYYQTTNFATQQKPTNITAFIGKLSPEGQLVWSTYYGGLTGENGIDVWVDKDNNLLVTGASGSEDFPVSAGAAQITYGGPFTGTVIGDVFVGKFNNSGVRQWMTLLGGPVDDAGYGVTSDTQGNVYVSGWSKGSFPVTAGAYQTTYAGGATDVIIAKFLPDGTRQWVSYYGGSAGERGVDIRFHNNFIYVAGECSSNLPGPSTGVTQPNYAGGANDGYLAKFSPDNGPSQLIWRCYTGGSGDDGFDEVTVNPAGNIVCGGFTNSTNYPASPNAFQTTHGGEYDGQAATFTENGERICATYFGGSDKENIYGLVCASNGDIIITGNVGSTTAQGFRTSSNAFQPNKSTGLDSYLARITEIPPPPIADFSTTPASGCSPLKVTLNNTSTSINTCYSNTTWDWSFPGGNPASSTLEQPGTVTYSNGGTFTITLKATNASGTNSISKDITVSSGIPLTVSPDVTICNGSSTLLTASGADTYTWSPAAGLSGTTGASVTANPTVTITYKVTGTNSAGCIGNDSVKVTVVVAPDVTASSGETICAGGNGTTLTVSGGVGTSYTYTWSPESGLSTTNGPVVIANPRITTTYQVAVEAGACPPLIIEIPVRVVNPPFIELSRDTTLCKGE